MSDQSRMNPAALARSSSVSLFSLILCPFWIVLWSAIALAQNSAQSPADFRPLVSGATVQREFTGGKSHHYQLALSAGQYLEISLEHSGVQTTARLVAPDGSTLAALKETAWGNTFITASLGVITQSSGEHRLELTMPGESAMTGRYLLKVEALRAATPNDIDRVAAHQLLTEARELQNQPDAAARRKSLEKYEQALKLWRALGETAWEAETLDETAASYYLLTDAAKMEAACGQALGLWRALGRRREQARTLSQLGLLAYVKYEQQKGRDYYNQALALHQESGDRFWEAETLNRLGWLHRSIGEPREVLECFLRALALRRQALAREGEGVTLNDLGRIYDELGEKQLAIDYFNQALALRPAEQNPVGAANVLVRVGLTYDSMGEKQKALDAYFRARTLLQQGGDRRAEGSLLGNIGLVYADLGDLTSALDFYGQALKLARETGVRNGEATTLMNIGLAYAAANDTQRAMEHYQQALALNKSINNRAGEAQTLSNLGNLHHQIKDARKAQDCYSQALAIRQALGDRRGQAVSLTGLGAVSRALGEKSKALEYFDRALSLHRAVVNRSGEVQTLRYLAMLSLDSGNPAKARALLEEALSIVESLRQNVISQELRASYFASSQDKYELYIDLLMQMDGQKPSEGLNTVALEANERSLARSLLELLTESRSDLSQGVSPALLAEERNLQQRLNARAEAQTRLLSGKYTEAQANAIAKEIAGLTTQYRDLQPRIRSTSPR
ncbi:MAG: tetratricopeptide repeat protein, partial [Blastocatellia bacterium]